MKITKNQLRRIIREACGLGSQEELEHEAPLIHWDRPTPQHPEDQLPPLQEPAAIAKVPGVPVPEDYNKVRDYLDATGAQELTISAVKQAAGTGCERSTAQGIIDYLRDRVGAMG